MHADGEAAKLQDCYTKALGERVKKQSRRLTSPDGEEWNFDFGNERRLRDNTIPSDKARDANVRNHTRT